MINTLGQVLAAPLFARHLAFLDKSLRGKLRNAETLKALAYSACYPTKDYDSFCGFGILDPRQLSVNPAKSNFPH